MTTVSALLQSSSGFNVMLEAEIAMLQSEDEIISLQRSQLMDGQRSDDQQIFNIKTGSEYYSPSYAKYKGKEEPIDLNDTGAFFEEITVDPASEGILIGNDNWKESMLIENYGKEIQGLNTESRQELAPIAGQRFIDNMIIKFNER